MTQKSIPWPGVAPDSGDDAGRYTAAEWWGVWAAEQKASGVMVTSPLLRTDAFVTNFGVYSIVDNQLEVTSPANNRIDVDTGMWVCDGQAGYNDTAIGSAGNITSPAANPRIDRVIVRKNFTSNTYDPANAGAAFDVPELTARITIIHGTEAGSPVAPSLIQDTARDPAGVFGTDGTWDIPLAQYEISTGGVISNLTDEREYVDEMVFRRKGGSATDWDTTGTTNYRSPGGMMQCGAVEWTGGAAASGSITVAYPQAYVNNPVVFATCVKDASAGDINASIGLQGIDPSQNFKIQWRDNQANTHTSLDFMWIAVGQGW